MKNEKKIKNVKICKSKQDKYSKAAHINHNAGGGGV